MITTTTTTLRLSRCRLLLSTAWLLAMVSGACAPEYRSLQQPSGIAQDRRDLEDAEQRLHQDERSLYASRVETERDCPHACVLAANICGLADRICTIAARSPDDRGIEAHCQDGRARCRRARDTTSACACESPASVEAR